jgi:DNA-binding SARP family transcriptional activator/class 3 adenylate cyclase
MSVEFSPRTVETAGVRRENGRSTMQETTQETTQTLPLEPTDGSLEIRVLGEFAVLRHGEPVELPPSRKTRALLAYLAVLDRSQQRERLCRMFWDLPDDPRGALRWSLTKIRAIVNGNGEDRLITDRNSVALRSQSIALDLRPVKALAMRGVAEIATSELMAAATLFRGGFLEDLSLPRCPEFEAWRTAHGDELDLIKARILQALVDRLAGEPVRALPYAHALLALHPKDAGLAGAVQALADRARGAAVAMPLPQPAPAAPPPEPAVAADPPPSPPPQVGQGGGDSERKHVTVLSIEIVSPLHAFASMDPELVAQQMDPLLEATIAIIERHGGIIAASADTGVTAVFGALPSGEHHAVAACRAALLVRSTIEPQSEGSVRLRAGLDTGEVMLRRRRRGAAELIEVTGGAVRAASRLARSLRRGALAATERTHAAVAGLVGMARLVRADFPGFDRDQRAYELQSTDSAR